MTQPIERDAIYRGRCYAAEIIELYSLVHLVSA